MQETDTFRRVYFALHIYMDELNKKPISDLLITLTQGVVVVSLCKTCFYPCGRNTSLRKTESRPGRQATKNNA